MPLVEVPRSAHAPDAAVGVMTYQFEGEQHSFTFNPRITKSRDAFLRTAAWAVLNGINLTVTATINSKL